MSTDQKRLNDNLSAAIDKDEKFAKLLRDTDVQIGNSKAFHHDPMVDGVKPPRTPAEVMEDFEPRR